MTWFDSPQIHMLARYMDLSAMRQALITSNIANVDTPGYRTKDIDFNGELIRAIQGQSDDSTEPIVHEVQGLVARPDGNNVSIDRESMLLAQVQLQFSTAEQVLKTQFKNLNLAINEGNSAI